MKLLVVASEAVGPELVRDAVGDTDDLEVLVIAPALTDSAVKYWLSDTDEAIERAERVERETVTALEREGVDAEGETGESSPLAAITDALATFDADEVLIVSHPDDEQAYREDELEDAEERLGIPVAHRTVGRD